MKSKPATTTKIRMGDVVMVRSRVHHTSSKPMAAMVTGIIAKAPLLEDDAALAIVSATAFPAGAQPVFLQVPLYEAEPEGAQTAAWVRR